MHSPLLPLFIQSQFATFPLCTQSLLASLCCYSAVIFLRCCPQLLIPPRSFHPRRHLNVKRHPLTTVSVWLRGKSLLGKHFICQAASFINVFPAGVKAPKMTSVHNKTFFSHFKSLYLWVYSDLNDTTLKDSELLSTVMCESVLKYQYFQHQVCPFHQKINIYTKLHKFGININCFFTVESCYVSYRANSAHVGRSYCYIHL